MEPTNSCAEEMRLINSLRRTDIEQLGRSVCRTNNHRHVALMSLNYCAVEMRRSCSGSTQENRRGLGGKTDPQRRKRRTALVMKEV